MKKSTMMAMLVGTLGVMGYMYMQKNPQMMENMRKDPPKQIGNYSVKEVIDYQNQTVNTNLPKSNVLYYELQNNSWCCMRPSGTEPKIKFYMGVCGANMDEADKQLEGLKQAILLLSNH